MAERHSQEITAGRSFPLGATISRGGVNFSLFSRGASAVELLFFNQEDDPFPSRVIPLDAVENRTSHYWHTFVSGIEAGQIYGYRVDGPWAPDQGLRFNKTKLLLDPYAQSIAIPTNYNREAVRDEDNHLSIALKGVVVDAHAYDWEGDLPLRRPCARTIIYEMHVAGFTKHPNSGIRDDLRGTYAGLIKKIPYLQGLGITAVELLPVFQFDAQDAPNGMANYWGYTPVSFFAPHRGYSSRQDPLGPVEEFRDMVKALHRAGIEVILDVVFNHTAEGDHAGPTLSFRGLDNTTYYILEEDRAHFANYSGCGNTLNANHPVVRRMILDSLRYWVREMHVDGFRFDLASILSRDSSGQPMANPPVLWDIDTDPVLAGTKIIAEAWDAAGLYQVGSFVGDTWREWNGQFRDDVRSFFRGDEGYLSRMANRMLGSPDIYGHKAREAEESVNFVTCHDGFTLNDLVSYNAKHNEPNRENNNDGSNDNRSWNCGIEGPTDNAEVERLRNRQVKNFLTCTLLSFGIPMISMGDEVRRTQWGNNNPYCQDNEISWFDWELVAKHEDVHRFFCILAQWYVRRDLGPEYQKKTLNEFLQEATKAWHGTKLFQPDWSDWSHSIAITAELKSTQEVIHAILNAYWEPLDFELPKSTRPWRRWIDTSLGKPNDIVLWEAAPPVPATKYVANPHSVVFLYTR